MGGEEDNRRSIPQTNALVRALVEQETLDHPFWIGGMVTRSFLSHLGHHYFDLNDDDYSISCMLREKLRGTLNFTITNGIEIEVFGAIRVYEKKAQVQIEVEKARLIESPPFVIDASVQEQLAQKGLWPKAKHPLPNPIKMIGIVTSKQSDALHDFEDTYRNEGGTARTKLIDVRLQGQQAVRDITEAINRLNQEKSVDVIALIRGGGHSAELATFDDILIAEAICQSAIPILTGIGHQRDSTLADQVADVTTITPTAAASHLARATQAKTEAARTTSISWMPYALGGLIVVIAILIALLILSPR
jgi:exodeoxyribonuclease VII large subunit